MALNCGAEDDSSSSTGITEQETTTVYLDQVVAAKRKGGELLDGELAIMMFPIHSWPLHDVSEPRICRSWPVLAP